MNTQFYTEALTELVQGMGAVALDKFTKPLAVETKRDGSPVTAADRAAEQFGREWISARFPQDGIEGEELDDILSSSDVSWIIDPIDGTRSFTRGVPLWGTLAAVIHGGRVIAGAASFPALGEAIAAGEGAGCWWNGSRASVSSCERLNEALVLTTDTGFFEGTQKSAWDSLTAEARMARTWGDCYGFLLVATGRAEVMVDVNLAKWDAAPFGPIIREAGGCFTDWEGKAESFPRDAIACNRLLSADVLKIVGNSSRQNANV
jgi:histidinol phosphatase-like enzyme (inositol monophosphatase family)